MTIFGSDVSHYDKPDTRAMFGQGVVFQTHKAGGDADDGAIGTWWNLVKGYRPEVLLGAYWVLYPGNPAGRADAFLARLDSQCPGWRDGPFILQADCEKWNSNPATVPSVAEINAFCDRLVSRVPKLRPIAYAPRWVYGDHVSGLRYPLWSSAYVTGAGKMQTLYPGDGSSRWGTYGGKAPDILQFTSSATIGGQTTCDANAFRGTFEQLIALLAPGWSTNDVTTKDDVTAALHDFFDGKPAGADQMTEFRIGQDGWKQPLPNVFQGGKRTMAYQVLTDLCTHVANDSNQVDPQAIATAVLAGIADQAAGAAATIAGMVITALPADLAKEVADEIAARLAN